jgi:cell wall-associated NlpC family hydrolase
MPDKILHFKTGYQLQTLAFYTLLLIGMAGWTACSGVVPNSPTAVESKGLDPTGYTVQVGSFSIPSNAIRLSKTLQASGLNAYYFINKLGLYKVRFGNYPSNQIARKKAEYLLSTGIINDYYIVGPIDRKHDKTYIRNKIVKTAKRFLGAPYRWGGTSSTHGFDCSGLTMVVYRLNGLNLPRSSKTQWVLGRPVNQNQILKADLVFFATSGNKQISHVGIYIGADKFIHAPSKGKNIRIDSLSKKYFRQHFIGARTYL